MIYRTRLPSNLRQATRECVYLITLVWPDYLSSDLDLDPMTLIYELDLDIPYRYLHTKNESSRSRHLKVRARTENADTLFPLWPWPWLWYNPITFIYELNLNPDRMNFLCQRFRKLAFYIQTDTHVHRDICRDGHEMLTLETETLASAAETRPRGDVCSSRDVIETSKAGLDVVVIVVVRDMMYFSIIHFEIAYRLSICIKISDLEWPWTA